MSTPQSLKSTPFDGLGSASFKPVLSDDYIHKKFGTLKLKAISTNKATINLKTAVSYTENKGEDGKVTSVNGKLSDELKFLFPFNRFHLETEVKRNGDLNYHLDCGNFNVVGKSMNVFANLSTKLKLDSFLFRIGTNFDSPACVSNSRLTRDAKGQFSFTQKNVLTHGDAQLSIVGNFDIDKLQLNKYDAQLKYSANKETDLYLQHLSNSSKDASLHVGKLSAFAVHRFCPGITVAAQVKRDFETQKTRFVAGVLKNMSKRTTLKGKVDNKLKVTGSGKWKVNDMATFTLGGQLNLQNGAKAFDFKKFLPIPLGWQLDLAV